VKSARVTGLNFYPVKSCAGVALEAARLTPSGFELDRHWMFIDQNDRFISQREISTLARVGVKVAEAALELSFGEERISVSRDASKLGKRERRTVTVWTDTFEALAYEESVGVDAWISKILGQPARLVEDEGKRRLKEDRCVPGFLDRVSFADGFPLMVLSEESLIDLNARIRARKPDHVDLPMNRFRPNVVIAGVNAYEEDAHPRTRIGDTTFLCGKPCERCVIPTIDQVTLATSKEPLATLATYRRHGQEVIFGQNLCVPDLLSTPVVLRVGDPVAFED